MNLFTFETYEEYVHEQTRLTRRKLEKPTLVSATTPGVVAAIKNAHTGQVARGLCHGVRRGEEVAMFAEALGGDWLGTEITPECCDGVRVLCRDFETIDNDWLGSIDAIYTNAFDHARRPWVALRAWFACLSQTGRLYVEWNPWSARLGRHGWRGDCFAASSAEYYELLNTVGRVERALHVPGIPPSPGGNPWEYLVFVCH